MSVLVTFGAISQAQSDVTMTVSNINHQMGDLKTYLAPIVATWSGNASEQYNALQQKWTLAAEDLNQALAQIGVALGNAHDNYLATEQAISNVWS